MPTLTGTIAEITGSPINPDSLQSVTVRAPSRRVSLAAPDRLVASVSVPVEVSAAGVLSVDLEPGPAVLLVEGDGLHDVYELGVTEDMTLLSEAVAETAPNRSWVESNMVQLQASAVEAAGDAEERREAAELAALKAEQERQAAELQRQHADQVAALLDEAYDQSQAGMTLPPRLMESVLNSTYVSAIIPARTPLGVVTHAALQAALDAGRDAERPVYAEGLCQTSETVTIASSHVDLSRLAINYEGTGIAVDVRPKEGSPLLWGATVQTPKVRHLAKIGPGWDAVAGTVGVRLFNAYRCHIDMADVQGFEVGQLIHAEGAPGGNGRGCAYNEVRMADLINNKVNQELRPGPNGGWVNENRFYGGNWSHESSEGVAAPGTRHIKIAQGPEWVGSNGSTRPPFPVNKNRWLFPCIEGAFGIVEYAWEFQNARYNTLYDPRTEVNGDPAAGTRNKMPVLWGANCQGNVVRDGYVLGRMLLQEYHPTALGNYIDSWDLVEQSTSSDAPFVRYANQTSGANGVLGVYDAPAMRAPGFDPATQWTMFLSSQMLRGKRTSDAHPRAVFDPYGSRILIGNGTVAPTAGWLAYGSAGIRPAGGEVYFEAGKGPILLASDGKKWRLQVDTSGVLSTALVP